MRHTPPSREVTHKESKILKIQTKKQIIYTSQLDFFFCLMMKLRKGPMNCCDPLRQRAQKNLHSQIFCKRSPVLSISTCVMRTLMQILFSLSLTHTHSHDHIFSLTRVCYTHLLILLSWESAKPLMMSFVSPNQPTNPKTQFLPFP